MKKTLTKWNGSFLDLFNYILNFYVCFEFYKKITFLFFIFLHLLKLLLSLRPPVFATLKWFVWLLLAWFLLSSDMRYLHNSEEFIIQHQTQCLDLLNNLFTFYYYYHYFYFYTFVLFLLCFHGPDLINIRRHLVDPRWLSGTTFL